MGGARRCQGEKGVKGIHFTTGGAELLPRVRPLWEALNRYHGERSTHFADEFAGFKFSFRERRFREKAGRGALRVELAAPSGEGEAAYCISSVSPDGAGEIDSLFVEERFRGRGIGGELMRRALGWMDEMGATSRIVVVAEGNERAHAFYAKFGLFPFSVTLARKGGDGRR